MKHLLILTVLSLFWLPESFAGFQITAQGAADINGSGYGFASSPNLLLGVQVTTDLAYPFQLGLAYEHNNLNYGDDGDGGNLRFYGIVGRIRTTSPFFIDVQAGINVRDTNGPSFSWGVGGAYAIPLISTIELAPRIGYRFVPDGGIERSLFDLGAVLIFKFI
jgi:hypothetical protein